MKKPLYIILIILLIPTIALAKVDLVTLPTRESVQLTIYNSADLTLARENRLLTLKQGFNELQFSWANTLIDPTSLEMFPKASVDQIDIFDLTYPPRVKNLGLWNIDSKLSGKVPVEITYLTSGLSWRAFYLGTLTPDEKMMRLKGYVRVTNNSGEDYENAQVRLIVGKVHLIDQIAMLAQRQYPYDRPGYGLGIDSGLTRFSSVRKKEVKQEMMKMRELADSMPMMAMAGSLKEIVKEGLSEYFLYTIEGTETIENGWSKRLTSFDVAEIPVVNLYKYEEDRYGYQAIRFLSFKNDKDHKLGDTPIPGGIIKAFRNVDQKEHLSYEGQSNFKYIPVDEKVELNLGAVGNVVIEPKLMKYKTENYQFDRYRNIKGWDEVRTFKVEVKNTRDVPVKVEIKRNFNTKYWDIKNSGDNGQYKKVDYNTVQYTLSLEPQTKKEFKYILRTYHGTREDTK